TGWTYLIFSLGAEMGGLAFCVGVGMALWRRTGRQQVRLLPSAASTMVLWLLLSIAVSGFLLEGARMFAWRVATFEVWSPICYRAARLMAGLGISGDVAVRVHLALWIFHAALVIVFFVVIPITILKHILLGAYSVAFPAGRPGLLHPVAEPITAAVDL